MYGLCMGFGVKTFKHGRQDWNDAGNRTATSVLEKRLMREKGVSASSCLRCSAQSVQSAGRCTASSTSSFEGGVT